MGEEFRGEWECGLVREFWKLNLASELCICGLGVVSNGQDAIGA